MTRRIEDARPFRPERRGTAGKRMDEGRGEGRGGGRYEKKRKSGIVKAARLICILIYRAFARASSANSEMRRGC